VSEFKRKRGASMHPDAIKAKRETAKNKKIKVSIIFNIGTHRMLKSVSAVEGKKISDVVEELVYGYLKDKGKVV
jgi:hypothetical protein